MRAVVAHVAKDLRVEDAPAPELGSHDISVQGIHADDASGTSGRATAIGNSSNLAPTQLQRNRRWWTLV